MSGFFWLYSKTLPYRDSGTWPNAPWMDYSAMWIPGYDDKDMPCLFLDRGGTIHPMGMPGRRPHFRRGGRIDQFNRAMRRWQAVA